MHLGLALSLVLHLGILAWALISIQATPELRAPDVLPIEVAIVTPSEPSSPKRSFTTFAADEAMSAEILTALSSSSRSTTARVLCDVGRTDW